ncbi:metallophosphoesterase family protein [Belliella marina]|uniref:Metallophosphoesterase family protein n=1 Tax=Belliella marina TaxID=1644146 RepID=A0ABW4VQ81_9BACT
MKKIIDNIGRRNFIGKITKGLGAGAVLGVGPVQYVLADPEEQNEGSYFTVMPYLQNPTPATMDILFVTRDPSFSWVELEDGEKAQGKFYAVEDGLIQANQRHFCVRLSGMSPGRTYRYKVYSKVIDQFKPYEVKYGDVMESQVYSFTTPDPGSASVSALVLNDLHQIDGVLKEQVELNGDFDFDFCLLNGDVFDHPESESQVIEKLLSPITGLFASEVPFMLARGNHETRGSYARNLKGHFSFPDGKYYYEFKNGPVQWVVLDTGEDKPDDHPVYAGLTDFDTYREEQALWLAKIFEQGLDAGILYRVVVMHIPPFNSGEWHGTLHCRSVFSPVFEKYGVDMVLSGHTHKHGFYAPCEDHSYTLIIGGGPRKGSRTITQVYANQAGLHAKLIAEGGEVIGKTTLVPQKK